MLVCVWRLMIPSGVSAVHMSMHDHALLVAPGNDLASGTAPDDAAMRQRPPDCMRHDKRTLGEHRALLWSQEHCGRSLASSMPPYN
jgi:hypothetical protein